MKAVVLIAMCVQKLLEYSIAGGLLALLMMLTGCTYTPQREAEIQRISPEELNRIMPKPMSAISLNDLVSISRTATPEELIEQIKASNSQCDLTASQTIELSKNGVDTKVLDYILQALEQSVWDSVA